MTAVDAHSKTETVHYAISDKSARLARISFGRAGDKNFDVGRIGPHYGGRGHVHDLGKEIHKLLPFSDDFRGHFDRMCHARAAILRLRSGPFSVDTPVHAEQFLGLDGEGSITAPAAVRDSSHGHPNRRCGQTSNVCSGSKADMTARICDVRFTPESGHSPTRSGCQLWAKSGPGMFRNQIRGIASARDFSENCVHRG
jgi:hypothetical protein